MLINIKVMCQEKLWEVKRNKDIIKFVNLCKMLDNYDFKSSLDLMYLQIKQGIIFLQKWISEIHASRMYKKKEK